MDERPEIAGNDEICRILTQIIRGEKLAEDERSALISERLKAIDLLGKTTELWRGRRRWSEDDETEFRGDEDLEE